MAAAAAASITFESVSRFHHHHHHVARRPDHALPSYHARDCPPWISHCRARHGSSLSISCAGFLSSDVHFGRWVYCLGFCVNSSFGRCRKSSVASASYEDSASVDTEVQKTDVKPMREELEQQAEESTETWNEAVHNFKDEAVKPEDYVKQSVEESAVKVMGVLRDTTEQLREQAEKARVVLAATAQETVERSKENLTLLAENAPDPIKDIAETALNAHSLENAKNGTRIHDFCLGIPYGSVLAVGGLLWFIISGSTAAIRFGVILGGALLALSVTSLKVWKQGKSSMPYIKAQAAITLIILIREIRRFFEDKALFPTAVAAIASAAMLGFYSYVYISGGNPPKKVKETPVSL